MKTSWLPLWWRDHKVLEIETHRYMALQVGNVDEYLQIINEKNANSQLFQVEKSYLVGTGVPLE